MLFNHYHHQSFLSTAEYRLLPELATVNYILTDPAVTIDLIHVVGPAGGWAYYTASAGSRYPLENLLTKSSSYKIDARI